MSFGEMMEILQMKNKGKIVICNAGEFYLATGKDAVLLKELIGLKLTCLKPEICKVGFPIASLEKYLEKIHETQYSYIVYYFNQQKEELEILATKEGKKINRLEKNNNNCYICSKSTKKYKKPDKYMIALAKLYEKEIELNKKKKKETNRREIWLKNKKKNKN